MVSVRRTAPKGALPSAGSANPLNPTAQATAAAGGQPGSGGNSRSHSRSPTGGGGKGGNTVIIPPSVALFHGAHTFRETVRTRLLTDVLGIEDEDDVWRVMVLDEHATRVISSMVGMYDIMEARVTVVEDLHKQRQPFRSMEAVYILSPSEESIERLKLDFPNRFKALYGSVHLFFTGPLSDTLLGLIRTGSTLVKRIKTLKEINMDFIAVEAQTYHLAVLREGANLFKDVMLGRTDTISIIAQRLVSLCATLNEFPYVRFSADSRRCEAVATEFHKRMTEFLARAPEDWHFHGQDSGRERGRSTLLLVDRAEDPLSPLMHEFTYQCLVQDLLPIEEGRLKYEVDTKEGKQEKEALLNDADELWVELRHLHIAKVLTDLGTRYKEILRSNEAAAALVGGGGREMSLEQMAVATRGLPEFQELTKKLGQHIKFAQQCSTKVSSGGLLAIGELEQTMALGIDDAGKKRTRKDFLDGWSSDGMAKPGLLELLSSRATSQESKLRLLAIFIITQKGITAQEKEELFGVAQLTPTEMTQLMGLKHLGVNTGEPDIKNTSPKKGFKFSLSLSSSGGAKPEDGQEFTLMRYTCQTKSTVERLLNCELSVDEYPSVVPLPEGLAINAAATGAEKGTKAPVRKPPAGGGGRPGAVTSYSGARTIVAFMSGVSYSEQRAMYELMLQYGREIVVGGTSVVGPKEYLDHIKALSAASGL